MNIMSNPEIEPKPIVGDDGELLEADSNANYELYEDYVWGYEYPTQQNRVIEVRDFLINNIAYIIMGTLLIVVVASITSKPLAQTLPSDKAQPLGKALVTPIGLEADTNLSATEESALGAKAHGSTMGQSINLSLNSPMSQIRWSPDGKYIALQSTDGVAIWDMNAQKLFFSGLSLYARFDWSSDSHFLYANRYQVSNPPQRSILSSLRTIGYALQYVPTLRQPPLLAQGLPKLMVASPRDQIALVSHDGLSVSVIEANRPDWLSTQTLDTPAHDLDWIGDSNWFSIVTNAGVRKWLPESITPVPLLDGQYQQVSWSPDGQYMAITQDLKRGGLHEPSITMMNPDHPNERWVNPLALNMLSIKDPANFNAQVAWSPDGKYIATFVQNDTVLELWDAKTGTRFPGFYNQVPITCIDWSPDGTYLAIGSSSDVTIWSPG
jgi:WD40 repeat protein